MKTKGYPTVGCYGDGTHGHQHTRQACADELFRWSGDAETFSGTFAMRQLAADLTVTEEDKAVECDAEIEACTWLNSVAAHPTASWGWRDGDFGLWPNDEE